VTQRTGGFMLEPTQMEDCQIYRPNMKSNRSTLYLQEALQRTTSPRNNISQRSLL